MNDAQQSLGTTLATAARSIGMSSMARLVAKPTAAPLDDVSGRRAHLSHVQGSGTANGREVMADKDKGGAKNKKAASKTLKEKREAKKSRGTSGSGGSDASR